jgi:hypothetical protein
VKALVAAAKAGQFAHVLERVRQDRDDAAQHAQAEADLTATGVGVIDAPGCLTEALMTALQGGLLLTTTYRTSRPLARALDMAIAHVRSHAAVKRT